MARIPSALIALALCWAASPSYALEIDFEDLGGNLPIDGNFFYDGRSAVDPGDPDATDFVSQDTTFNNEFTEFFPGCCWQGWSYSQTTDVVTAGPANQYSSVTGAGVNGSATYGVGFSPLKSPRFPESRFRYPFYDFATLPPKGRASRCK